MKQATEGNLPEPKQIQQVSEALARELDRYIREIAQAARKLSEANHG